MADITLKLKVVNSEAIQKLQQMEKETEKLYKTVEKNDIRSKGLIEEQIDRLDKLKEARRKAHDVKDIEIYNKGIQDSTDKIKEFETAGIQAEKQTQSLTQTIGKWALSLGGAVAALKLVKDAVLATTVGINAFNVAGAAAKQVMYNLVTGATSLTQGLQGVIEAQRELNRLRIQDKIDTYNSRIEQLKFNQALIQAKDQTKSVTDRIKAYRKIVEESPGNEKAVLKVIELETQLIELRIRETSAMKEISSMRSGLILKQQQEQIDALERIKSLGDSLIDAFAKDSEDLFKETNKQIQKEIDELNKMTGRNRKGIEKFFDDTWKDMVEGERDSGKLMEDVWKLFGLKQKDLNLQVNKNILQDNKDQIAAIKKQNQDALDEELENREKYIQALKESISSTLNVLQSITDREFDTAQRRREIFDTRISELQRTIDTEAQLEEAGMANNLNLKKRELEKLKEQRDKAIKVEEAAAKRQRQIDTLTQVSALITTSANTWKTFGFPFAIPIIAAIFAAFAASKIKAREATKLAKGGSGTDKGIVGGKTHAQGGERFADNIEVERGEAWGVLSAPATHKFGKVFHHMVSSFNKGEIPQMTPVNNISTRVNVENNGPNSRLDRVIREQQKLNDKLSNESIQELTGARVVKKGNSIRIVRR